ncbi:EsaB/YukD family protein [Streptococcus sp. H31]|uniref:EsaB/YukD family protein n=1 Tax=Streptococcus huangxiaojuni TaxID=3237239 RepID=UPI0034A438C8
MDSHINITILNKGKRADIRLPENMEVSHLIKELDTIFNQTQVRKKYQIRVVNKGLILDEGKVLKDYPVTTGDLLEIMEDGALD